MTNASDIRKNLDLVAEAGRPAQSPNGADRGKNVKVNLETLAREVPQGSKAKYDFNRGFLTFQDIMDDPRSFLEKYRKESQRETNNLVNYMSGMKPNPKYTDKEKYLRDGYESRGFSNGSVILVWWKEKRENLFIFTSSKDALVEVRDFLKFFRVIA